MNKLFISAINLWDRIAVYYDEVAKKRSDPNRFRVTNDPYKGWRIYTSELGWERFPPVSVEKIQKEERQLILDAIISELEYQDSACSAWAIEVVKNVVDNVSPPVVIHLTPREWEQLEEELNKPAQPNPALQELFRRTKNGKES